MRLGGKGAALAVVIGAVAIAPQVAQAAIGDLSYQGCISSNTNQTTCALLGASAAGANDTPLDQTIAEVESPDGRNLYVTGGNSDAVNTFTRDPATGALTFSGCLTGDTDTVGCTPIAGATAGGVNNGVDAPFSIAVSADGKSLYTGNLGADSLSHYTRDPATGALAYGGCVSSDTAQNTKCVLTPVAAAGGDNTALEFPSGVAVSPDGRSIYLASEGGASIARFSRDPVTGAFGGFQGCITGDTDVSANPGLTLCTPIAGATAGGGNTGLSGLNSVAVSSDNNSVYATGRFDDDLVRFNRNTTSGALTFGSCIGSDSGVANCTKTPVNAASGDHTGLDSPFALAVSPDGANAYVAAIDGDAISRFKLDPATGSLVGYQDCLTSESTVTGCTSVPGTAPGDDNSPLDGLGAVAVGPSGTSVYAGAGGGDSVTRFDRDATTGALSFNSCFTSNTTIAACAQVPGACAACTNAPLTAVEAVVASADGKNVYVTGVVETVSRFDVEGQPPVTPPTPPKPDNTYDIAGLKKNKRKGTAKVTVTVPGPGELVLSGKNLKTSTATAQAAGDAKLGVKTKGKLKKKLRRQGKRKITLDITFTPSGGDANTESFGIKLIRRG